MAINIIDENERMLTGDEETECDTSTPTEAKKITEMSITKALVIKKRLSQEIMEAIRKLPSFYVYTQNNSVPSGYETVDEFKKSGAAYYQSLVDKKTRYYKIVMALAQANATTKVLIGNKEYTLASALEYKKSINMEKELFTKLINQQRMMIELGDKLKKEAEEKVNTSINQLVGKDKKVDSEDVNKLMETLRSKHECTCHLAIDINDVVEKNVNRLNEFISDVDVAITETNSRTMLQIED